MSEVLDGLPWGPALSDIGVVGIVIFLLMLIVTGRLVPKRELDRVTAEADARVERERVLADARVEREKELADSRVERERDIGDAWQSAWGAERAVSAQAIAQRDALADEYAATAAHVIDSLPPAAAQVRQQPQGGTA